MKRGPPDEGPSWIPERHSSGAGCSCPADHSRPGGDYGRTEPCGVLGPDATGTGSSTRQKEAVHPQGQLQLYWRRYSDAQMMMHTVCC